MHLLLVDSRNKQLWYPDPSTRDSDTDTGKLNLIHQEYSSQWTFNIPSDSKLGEYKALILLCGEDPILSNKDGKDVTTERRIIDFQEKMFYVIP
jgi:hypothetical protein